MSVNKNSGSSWIQLTNETPTKETLNRTKSALHNKSNEKLEETLEKKIRTVGMTRNADRNMRDDVFLNNSIASWGDTVKLFEDYIEDKEGLTHILRNLDNNSKIYIDNSHRFEEAYKKEQMAKFYAVEKKSKEYYENPKTVMLTLSASPYSESGELLNPVDHLDSLMDRDLGSWNAVKSAKDRVLEDFDHNYMRILEPHTPKKGDYGTSGYVHQHVGLVVDDPNDELNEDMFKPVMRSHINNCKTAGRKAHTVKNNVSIFEEDEEKDGSLGSYLTAYMGEMLEEDPRDADPYFKRFLSLLWASNRRRIGFSNEANEWIREDYKEKFEEEEDDKQLPEFMKKEDEEVKDKIEVKRYEYWGIGFQKENGEIEEHKVEVSGSGSYTSSIRDNIELGEDWIEDEAEVAHFWTDPP